MGIFHPGAGTAAFADDRADVRAGNDIDPRRGCALARLERDDIFTSVGREAPQAIAENAIAHHQRLLRFGFGLPYRIQTLRHTLCRHPARHLLGQCFGTVGENDASDRLEQNPVLLGQFFGASQEHATRSVDNLRFGTGVDQPDDAVVQFRAVAREIFIHDHQVREQAFHAPVGMGLQYLFDQVDAVNVTDTYQHDRQIARDRKAPQPRLTQRVAADDAGCGTTQGIGVNHGAGEAAIDLCIGFAGVDVTQHFLALEPCHFKSALNKVPVTIPVEHRQCRLTRVRDTGDDLYRR